MTQRSEKLFIHGVCLSLKRGLSCFIAHTPSLLCCSAKPLLGHHALVWMVGFRMAGFMLSGSGIRVFVLGNMDLGGVDGEKWVLLQFRPAPRKKHQNDHLR